MKAFDNARLRDARGTTAVEFAIIAPVFMLMVVGTLYLCMLLFTVGSLQYAVEESARCAAVKSTICSDSPSTISYAQNHFYGSGILTPTFTYTALTCGYQVKASASYIFNFGQSTMTVPISAQACFP